MLSEYRITVDSPWYLTLLVLVPILWWWGYRGLAALGPGRRIVALALRSLVLALFIFAIAETRAVRTSERVTVLYLLDQSQSIPAEAREAMVKYVNESIRKHREERDRAGVIVFGRDAAIEVPPFDDDVQVAKVPETAVDPDYTNLAAAMRLALASFPEDAARRVVVVTDGNENLGNAMEQAQALAAAGVGIDVVPVRYQRQGEVILERMILPSDARRGQPLDLKVVITNTREPAAGGSGEVPGRLIIKRGLGDQSMVVGEERITLPPGKKVFTIRQQLDQAGFFSYEATFVPDRPEDDAMRQNNRATTFTHVQGKGQVLLIEDEDHRGEYGRLVAVLRQHNIEVNLRSSKEPFGNLAELQPYDSVVLANVPRERFTDTQLQMLVRNTQQMGAGLIMLGGPNSFGAGGWANTDVEKAMPVDFTIKSAKVVPRGALAMLMHASEMAQGNYWQKVIAVEALKALGPRDYCGVIHYGGPTGTEWLWKPGMTVVGERRAEMLARLDRMAPGDMPDFDPGLNLAYKGLAGCEDAGVRHLIVISDGDPSPPSRAAIQSLIDAKITVSSVAVGAHGPAESAVMQRFAEATGGKFYKVNDPQMLPRIFQREARRVAQPLIYENLAGFQPRVRFPHEILNGVEGPLYPITGFVLTTRKENPLVEVSLISPQPSAEQNSTILASWTYGLGRTVAFTTDGTARWTLQWLGWENYGKLMSQMVRWSMRPSGDQGKFTVATDLQNGQVRMTITALDKDDEFLNFLDFSGTVVGPDLQPIDMKVEQVAPGRYVGTFPAGRAGSYLIVASPGAGKAPLRTGINVPYSDEFRALEANVPLLEQIAALAPEGGEGGQVIQHPDGFDRMDQLLESNPFRPNLMKATSSQDAWYYLVLAASCLFFFDVFVRRVQVSFAWVPRLAARLIGRKPPPPPAETIQRLRSRKAEVGTQIDQLRAGARFEAPQGAPADVTVLEAPRDAAAPPKPPAPTLTPQETAADSYTERLLKAKKKAWEQKK